MFNIRFKLRGGQELVTKLEGDALLGNPWRELIDQVKAEGVSVAQSGAPRASGKLAGSIRGRASNAPMPKWLKIEVKATRSSARYPKYPYPRRLEFDPRLGHAGWFSRPLQGAAPRLRGELDRFAANVRGRWGR